MTEEARLGPDWLLSVLSAPMNTSVGGALSVLPGEHNLCSRKVQDSCLGPAHSPNSVALRGTGGGAGRSALDPTLRDFAVTPGAVLRGALGRPDGFGPLQAVALAASCRVG